jgi:hypothetical protein
MQVQEFFPKKEKTATLMEHPIHSSGQADTDI